jgi:hypothetical protein
MGVDLLVPIVSYSSAWRHFDLRLVAEGSLVLEILRSGLDVVCEVGMELVCSDVKDSLLFDTRSAEQFKTNYFDIHLDAFKQPDQIISDTWLCFSGRVVT